MTTIHKTAIIEDGAQIDQDVSVGPYTIVGSNVKISGGTEIGSHVSLQGHIEIGPDNQIGTGAVIGSPPQDWGYEGGPTGVKIGSSNILREYVTVNRSSTEPDGMTVIGDDNMLMSYCHVAHDCVLGNGIAMANGCTFAGHVTVEDNVMMGGLTPVHQFVRIGEYSMVGGMSRINKDVPPYSSISGNPPQIYGINSVGLKRNDFTKEDRNLLKKAFKMIYRNGLNTTQALERIEEELPDQKHILHLIDFIRTSERGVHK